MFCNFYPSSMNSLDFFTLQGSIFCIFDLLGMNFGNFHPWGWILCNFYPLRLNSLQFLPFKGEIFASFTFLRFFLGWKGQKITLVMVNFLKFWFFHSLRLNFLHFFILKGWILSKFSPFKGELFAFFTLKGWILCNFHS